MRPGRTIERKSGRLGLTCDHERSQEFVARAAVQRNDTSGEPGRCTIDGLILGRWREEYAPVEHRLRNEAIPHGDVAIRPRAACRQVGLAISEDTATALHKEHRQACPG